VCVHGLRHAFVSLLASGGLSLPMIGELLRSHPGPDHGRLRPPLRRSAARRPQPLGVRTRPVPSQCRILTRCKRLPRNTNSAPESGSCCGRILQSRPLPLRHPHLARCCRRAGRLQARSIHGKISASRPTEDRSGTPHRPAGEPAVPRGRTPRRRRGARSPRPRRGSLRPGWDRASPPPLALLHLGIQAARRYTARARCSNSDRA